ncbi:MAG: hypothetical protein R2824_06410 [Saprospiraceae bacterium]|nr:hypothetical protein [Lewinella sp.]
MISIRISKHHRLGEYLRYSTVYGLTGAVLMTIFELLLHFAASDRMEGMHMLGYLIFFAILGTGTYRARNILNEGYEANDTIIIGLMIAAATGLSLIVLNVLLALFHIPVEVGMIALPITSGWNFAVNAMGNLLIDINLGFLSSIIFVYLFNRN